MATLYSIDISTVDHDQPMISGAPRPSLRRLINFLLRLKAGGNTGATTISVRNTGVKATGTITCATTIANDTVTINGVVFTAVAGVAGANQYSIDGVGNTLDAAALAAAINASVSAGIVGIVTATSNAAVVTVSAAVPGKIGNAITLASSDGATLAVSAARLAGGSESAFTFSL